MTVLDSRALNRATLARQLLLERADVPVLDAVAHLGFLVLVSDRFFEFGHGRAEANFGKQLVALKGGED